MSKARLIFFILSAQDNARDGDFNLRYVKNFLIRPNEYFCDSLIKIYESNRFDRQTMLNKLPRDIKDKVILII